MLHDPVYCLNFDLYASLYSLCWKNVFALLYIHSIGVYGLCMLFTGNICLKSFGWIGVLSGVGITIGAHRLFSHRSFKANILLKIIFAFLSCMSFQGSIYDWARDHRVHHKYSETDADPHNANRGFFFSHVGWLLYKKHKDVVNKGKSVDMSDLENDAVIMFQRKYFLVFGLIFAFILPTIIPCYFWNETVWISWVATVTRYGIVLNVIWSINSVAHKFGTKPYDKYIGATENPLMVMIGFGEGSHNFHHTFPWDYRLTDKSYTIDISTSVIRFFAKIGWATNLKMVASDTVKKRALATGDSTWWRIKLL